MKNLTFFSLIFSFLLVCSANSAPTELDRLKGVMDAVLEVVYGEGSTQLSVEDKQAKVRSTLESEYDLDIIIRRAIGRNWNLMNEKEQVQVLELVKKLVVKTFVKSVEGSARPEVQLGEMVMITDTRMEIPSTVAMEESTVNVLYRLGKMQSGWQIYDIVAEDISVVSNYRQQIDDHFRKGNGQELIDKLSDLLAKENLDEEIQL